MEIATEAFIEECAAFPNGARDDQVDAMTQTLNRIGRNASAPRLARFGGRTREGPS